MGKKSKKTRWRTLTLNGHQSDSEESSSKSSLQTSKNYQPKYSKFPYSSQSTPIRKFQHDSSKSTRSNSTTSEHKATFNEDEYTRITTPRQDVLFKKGYLSKPKSYQTQTSTGTSSTANSTSTCTPDHQSADGTEGTDLEYESQFVFPNGFIDQNGIYYINSFEPFPFVVYNAPICYSEYPNSRSKRYSTDSLTESMSPHNEESSQDLSQNGAGERINNTPVFNQTYLPPASYYYNGVCTSANGQYVTEEPRKLKKKRRRKLSRSKSNQEEDATSEGSDEDDSSDEVFSQTQGSIEHKTFPKSSHQPLEDEETTASPKIEEIPVVNGPKMEEIEVNGVQEPESLSTTMEEVDEPTEREGPLLEPEENQSNKSNISEAQSMLLQSLLKNSEKDASENPEAQESEPLTHTVETDASNSKYSLKPDAEEFIPRTFRAPEAIPFDPNVQFLNLQPNFIPIPFVNHLGELQRPPFLPPGIPLNFVPSQDPKLLPNFVNIVPNGFVPRYPEAETETETHNETDKATEPEEKEVDETMQEEEAKDDKPEASQTEIEVVPVKKAQTKNEIDIAKIVSKLEEAAKQQRFYENKRQGYGRPSSRYNTSRPYATQRGRFNRYHPENRYQRSRPNSLDEDRNYRKPEGYQREPRTRPNYERASSVDNKRSETPSQVDESVQTTRALNEPAVNQRTQVKHQAGDHHPVNNVNSRIRESCSIGKDLKLESTINYSESLKKNAETNTVRINAGKCARYEKHEKTQKKIVSPAVTPKPQPTPNQWIPVSRKKRKNKGSEEQNMLDLEETEVEPVQNDDLFESFDVNQLVDVVPPSQLPDEDGKTVEENLIENTENLVTNAESITKDVVEAQALETQPSVQSEVAIKGLEDASTEESAKSIEVIVQPEEEPPAKIEEIPVLLAVKSGKKKQNEQKKKSKKGTQKPLTRRVMINDVDLELTKAAVKEETNAKTEEVLVETNTEVEQPKQTMASETQETAASKTEDVQPVELNQPAVSEDPVNNATSKLPIKPNEAPYSAPTSQTQTSESDTITDTPEKKSKKKKKKAAKPALVKIQSVSSSTTTLSNLDDSYDFLLENSVLEDFEQKTNVEISQELDRMIQKGMYSSLEEKIRSLRINATDDGFFKTINYGVFHTHVDVEKPNSIKASNFGEMLKNTTQLLKPPRVSDEIDNQNLINIDFSKIKLPDLEPQPSTLKSGIFLENPLVNELIKNAVEPSLSNDPQQPSSKTKNNGKLKNKSKKEKSKKPCDEATGEAPATIELESKNLTTSKIFSYHDEEPTEQPPINDDPLRKTPPKQDSLYPITQAVKEWMTKTRENTPDIEILKSPNTIYKEFYASETENSKNGPAKSLSRETSPLPKRSEDKQGGARATELTNDEEITIWSVSPQNSVDEDLLDCWENDLTNGCKPESEGKAPNVNPKRTPVLIPNGDIKEVKGSVHNGGAHLNGHIEEGEEAIEIYESKYGKNEDFLRLKAEIEEQQKNLNFPRHGNLPYRAICCSIM